MRLCGATSGQYPRALPNVPTHIAALFVALAGIDGTPAAINAGKLKKLPPPATLFIAPARNAAPANGLYLEDLRVGQRFTSGTYRMDESRIKAFAEEFDPQAFHLDDAAARNTVFRGLAASGWHTAAVTMRLVVTGGIPFASGLIGLNAQAEWPRPTRPGDTLHVNSEIMEITPSHSKPNQGVVTVRCVTVNQNGDPVQVLTTKILVFKRTDSPA